MGATVTGAPIDLGDGVWQFRTALWQTSATAVIAAGEALVCDPCWTPGEIAAIRDWAAERAATVRLIVTHADYDHVCGIGFFPGSEVIAGESTAEAIRSGRAAEALAGAATEWGLDWPLELRVDRVVAPDEEVQAGPFRLAALDARGHVADGTAWLLPDRGLLLPGDYLSAMTYPFVTDSLERALATSERLLATIDRSDVPTIDRSDVRLVAPGHGPALSRADARQVAVEDLRYLERLQAAAQEAADLPPGPALLHVYAVEPPRETTPDFDLFGLRAWNARRALAEARSEVAA
jgi:glyoxylase-like metal-dependent hydrolase (beta-lactamase superfamily II)